MLLNILTSALSFRLICTNLFQQSQCIKLCPQFYVLPFMEASDDDICHFYLFPRWDNALEITPVGATRGHKAYHLVIFGNLLLHFMMQVGESSIEQGHEALEPIPVRGPGISGKVREAAGAEERIDGRPVFVQFL